jgi:RIO kinase 1
MQHRRADQKIYQNVFDNFTERTLFKLMSQKHFDGLIGPVQIGKEANVFLAQKGKDKIIVKIYRIENAEFKRMFEYIRKDMRYQNMSSNNRKIIFSWVQREYRNIFLAREAGVNVPTPIAFVNNILVLEYIGDSEPAPRLKDSIPKNPKKFFKDVLDNMRKLHKAGMVHADLSEFNILNHHEKPVFIDFSQTTLLKSPNSEELVARDVRNIARFFIKIGVKTSEEEIKKYISKK